MSETGSAGRTSPTRSDRTVRVVGWNRRGAGVVFLVAGVVTYAVVSSTLAAEKITVSPDAAHFGGKEVKGPFTAYAQTKVIAKHAKEIGGGRTMRSCRRTTRTARP